MCELQNLTYLRDIKVHDSKKPQAYNIQNLGTKTVFYVHNALCN